MKSRPTKIAIGSPTFAGNGDAMGTLKEAWAEFRDDGFILQFLSPQADPGLPSVPHSRPLGLAVRAGPGNPRRDRLSRCPPPLSEQYDTGVRDPDIQVVSADLSGDRRLVLHHRVRDGVLLDKNQCDRTLFHVAHLWGYRVKLMEMDIETGEMLKEHEALPMP